MSDAAYIELPPKAPKRSFFRSWRAAVLLLFIGAVILAGCFSWWLAQGKITSSYARVDTVVYTVEPETMGRVDSLLVGVGADVLRGQALAYVNPDLAGESAKAQEQTQELPFMVRLNATQETEKKLVGRLAKARADEERYRKILQDRVTEHVSAQLALRAIDHNNLFAYQPTAEMEAAARQRMNLARDDFEKVSKARAAMEVELERIRLDLVRKKQRSRRLEAQMPEQTVKKAPQPSQPEILYAPVAGRILDLTASQGQIVQKGQPVFMIMPTDKSAGGDTWIQAWFPLSDREKLKVGQKVQIKAGDQHLPGVVSAIAQEGQYLTPAAYSGRQNQAQYLGVRIQVENEADLSKLTPGANVECQIQTRYVLEQGFI